MPRHAVSVEHRANFALAHPAAAKPCDCEQSDARHCQRSRCRNAVDLDDTEVTVTAIQRAVIPRAPAGPVDDGLVLVPEVVRLTAGPVRVSNGFAAAPNEITFGCRVVVTNPQPY